MQTRLWFIASTVLFCSLLSPLTRATTSKGFQEISTHAMVSLGDSLTAATLADTSLVPRAGDPPMTWKDIHDRALYDNKLTLSWASGSQINSHRELLRAYLNKNSSKPIDLQMLNLSVPGARAKDIEPQVDQLILELKKGKISQIEYITLFIGNNDVCSTDTPSGTPDQKLRDQLKKAFKKLAQIHQNTPLRILMVGMPRIADLGFPEIRKAEVIRGMNCELVRDVLLKYCPQITRWKDSNDYQRAAQVVADKVQTLQEIAQDLQNQYPGSMEIVFTDALQNFPISRDLLAIDCFHPNDVGQQKVSDLLWQAQPWFK